MKAAQINDYGDTSIVKVVDNADKPLIAENQVLVEVDAASVNPFDNAVLAGYARQMAELNFPATLGGDLAGTVSEIGKNVDGFEIGQKVYGQGSALSGNGSFAEFTPVLASQLSKSPTNIKMTEAAALPLVSVSAYQALVDTIELQSGQKILVHGGAGGIGSVAIQIAKNIGAYVATTAQKEDIEYVKNLGADEVIDYKSQDFSEILKNYDAVFDTVGGDTTIQSIKVLKKGGSLVSMVNNLDEKMIKESGIKFTHQYTQVTPDRLQKITELVEAGKLKINVAKVFPLEQTNKAMEYLKIGHPKGKVVIQVKS